MRERVEAAAAAATLRGARRHVLAAVLKLLCGWSKITDDQVALPQVVELIAAAGGRRYDLKTVGRALAGLAADELIVYRAAQGRGTRSFIAIHDRFVADIKVLSRDRSGRVVVDHGARSSTSAAAESVTFSEPLPYKNQTHYPPTPRPAARRDDPRPVGLEVNTEDLRQVMRELPAVLAHLPRHLRWLLGHEVRLRLERGWRPEQLLDVLSAPTPADVARPWRLAMWRLHRNVVGAGPRLRPLQQDWDRRHAAAQRTAAEDVTTRWFDEVTAVTDTRLRADVLRATEVRFGRSCTDPIAAIAAAGRRMGRDHPGTPLAEALAAWVAEVLDGAADERPVAAPPVATSLSADLLRDVAISGGCRCVVCGSDRGVLRPELPLKSMATVCGLCWPHVAADLVPERESELREAIPA